MVSTRSVVRKVVARDQSEGVGARVRRSVGSLALADLDPFLLLDEFTVSPPAGFPDHPHCGFETVTYMLKGKFQHKDNKGNAGVIGPGDLQWMTAGRGIIHSEMPATDGDNVGLQLWVNLPSASKRVAPNYQELSKIDVPVAATDGVHVRVIAGGCLGVEAKVRTHSPITYLDVALDAGVKFDVDVPRDSNGFAYVLEGSGDFGNEHGEHGCCLVMSSEGDALPVVGGTKGVRFVVIAGKPIREPVAKYGPFVMNTSEELIQATRDYHANRF